MVLVGDAVLEHGDLVGVLVEETGRLGDEPGGDDGEPEGHASLAGEGEEPRQGGLDRSGVVVAPPEGRLASRLGPAVQLGGEGRPCHGVPRAAQGWAPLL
ncbi:MAG: hypothetical protein DMD79_02170 [Candidatus Rokuibacteriota bacterium]|nr:MAG: hypothetical protein DMD79_02170 [Candidatus Rokubacteria bacterium]